MGAAADGERQVLLPGEVDGSLNVRGVSWTDNQRGTAIDHHVPHPPRRVVVRVGRRDDVSAEGSGEGVDRS